MINRLTLIRRRTTQLFVLAVLLTSLQLEAKEKAPNFRLRDINNKQLELDSFIGKGPIVIDFWATWCKPCIKYLPKLQKFYSKYKKQGLMIISINEDGPRNYSKIKPFVNSAGLKFPVLLDENSNVMRRYRVLGLPTTILISPEGTIFKVHTGYKPGDEKQLEKEILSLLNKSN